MTAWSLSLLEGRELASSPASPTGKVWVGLDPVETERGWIRAAVAVQDWARSSRGHHEHMHEDGPVIIEPRLLGFVRPRRWGPA